MRWHLFGRPGRQRTHSRPRVARAALAARSVQLETGALVDGNSTAMPMGVVLASQSARRGGGLGSAQLGASPFALMAAARASNRSVEEVWEETLTAWLGAAEESASARQADPARQRRRTVWHEIDSTLLALRLG